MGLILQFYPSCAIRRLRDSSLSEKGFQIRLFRYFGSLTSLFHRPLPAVLVEEKGRRKMRTWFLRRPRVAVVFPFFVSLLGGGILYLSLWAILLHFWPWLIPLKKFPDAILSVAIGGPGAFIILILLPIRCMERLYDWLLGSSKREETSGGNQVAV